MYSPISWLPTNWTCSACRGMCLGGWLLWVWLCCHTWQREIITGMWSRNHCNVRLQCWDTAAKNISPTWQLLQIVLMWNIKYSPLFSASNIKYQPNSSSISRFRLHIWRVNAMVYLEFVFTKFRWNYFLDRFQSNTSWNVIFLQDIDNILYIAKTCLSSNLRLQHIVWCFKMSVSVFLVASVVYSICI